LTAFFVAALKEGNSNVSVQRRDLTGDCEPIAQSILNRYPLILVECEERTGFNLVRLRLRPESAIKEVRITQQDYLDGTWEQIVDDAVHSLYRS
jgi:hypothetical protein